MPKQSRRIARAARHSAITTIMTSERESEEETEIARAGSFSFFRKRLWIVAAVAFVSIGAFGAVLKDLENAPKSKTISNSKDGSFVSSLNPFAPVPTPLPLSKEYIYAGSRMLAVEDANANAAPPADLAIWRQTTGDWWVLSGSANGSYGSNYATGWGVSGDIPVPGDYDGDGKTDFAVYRPSTGTWWINESSSGNSYNFQFGNNTDKPVPADYDGDGRTDAAFFRKDDPTAGSGTFYIHRYDGSYYSTPFGLSGDKPASADFDGDGKADVAVWRDSNQTYYSLNSSNGGVSYRNLAVSSSEPVPADYDGDGKADYAVRQSSSSNWVIYMSATSSISTVAWQNSSDVSVQNDYDGDGKCDIAVWRPADSYSGAGDTGNWYIRTSANTTSPRIVHWGVAGDTPEPAYFRR